MEVSVTPFFLEAVLPAAEDLVEGEGGESTVKILTREGGVDNSETARKILSLLYDQLK